ncbi:hypothetical protein B0A65_19100 [Flavobacterium frigidimaris]|uniref:Uncharacterized protein n=1 Tax=Flavobacterium frigidimaris TaxID=262320 RepID=A0ABX4BLK0_FLAFR|nr:hypothetical protein B0A65_19100 [Flavobacterium frigidimaris]
MTLRVFIFVKLPWEATCRDCFASSPSFVSSFLVTTYFVVLYSLFFILCSLFFILCSLFFILYSCLYFLFFPREG